MNGAHCGSIAEYGVTKPKAFAFAPQPCYNRNREGLSNLESLWHRAHVHLFEESYSLGVERLRDADRLTGI
jgi:hypothetical protein